MTNTYQRKFNRIAVTGAAGFIGSHLVEALLADEGVERVLAIDNMSMGSAENLRHISDKRLKSVNIDVRKYDDLAIHLSKNRIDSVLHLATTPLVFSLKSPLDGASTIIDMQLSLLECLKDGHFGHLLTFSTSEVYGSSPGITLTEESRIIPQTPYAAAKASSDMLTTSYFNSFNLDCTIIRPFNNYGPRKRVMAGAGIIPTAIKRLSMGLPVQVFGDGSTARDFVFVKDTVNAVIAAARDTRSSGEIFNVATGQSRSVMDILIDLSDLMKVPLQVEYMPARSADVSHLRGSGAKIADILGFRPATNWLDGLHECVEYYSRHEE